MAVSGFDFPTAKWCVSCTLLDYLARRPRSFVQDDQVPLHRTHQPPPRRGIDAAVVLGEHNEHDVRPRRLTLLILVWRSSRMSRPALLGAVEVSRPRVGRWLFSNSFFLRSNFSWYWFVANILQVSLSWNY